MKITFNTGRGYTAEGQVITVEFDPEGEVIHFNDHSRMIRGKIPYVGRREFDAYYLADVVMKNYDVGNYGLGERYLEREDEVKDYKGYW